MKNLFFTIIALVSFSSVSIANNKTKEFKKIEINVSSVKSEDLAKNTCCTRRGKSSNGQSVSITACVQSTGDLAIDMGNACGKATSIAAAAVEVLDNLAT